MSDVLQIELVSSVKPFRMVGRFYLLFAAGGTVLGVVAAALYRETPDAWLLVFGGLLMGLAVGFPYTALLGGAACFRVRRILASFNRAAGTYRIERETFLGTKVEAGRLRDVDHAMAYAEPGRYGSTPTTALVLADGRRVPIYTQDAMFPQPADEPDRLASARRLASTIQGFLEGRTERG